MLSLALRRLPQIALTLVLLSLAAWFAIGLMPGDPASLALVSDPRLTAEDAARLRALHGLDQPLIARYLAWAGALLRGELGYSRLYAQPVADVLWPALRSTLVLVGSAVGLAALAGVALGGLAALRPRTAPFVDAVALLGEAMPASGWASCSSSCSPSGWAGCRRGRAAAGRGGLALPGAAGGHHRLRADGRLCAPRRCRPLGRAGAALHHQRPGARGGEGRILWRHALPNAAVPLLTLLALDAGALVSGALVTETVFARPGMGKLLYDAVMGNDYNLALLALLLVALVTMLATLAADLAQRWLDPRIEER
ncbi:ABC transporter permease [Teichococcus aestuarii]|uniref:ABC transporter permease n=1 Tax=Teichococcus aestuarii TaxID=568898 RepID=UPI003620E1EB